MPVSGLSTPILTLSAARARKTKGLATCPAPRTSPACNSLRRPIGFMELSLGNFVSLSATAPSRSLPRPVGFTASLRFSQFRLDAIAGQARSPPLEKSIAWRRSVMSDGVASQANEAVGSTAGDVLIHAPSRRLHAGHVILQPLSSRVPTISAPLMTLVTLKRSSGVSPPAWALPTKRLAMNWFCPAR